jgi:hypothetical protein
MPRTDPIQVEVAYTAMVTEGGARNPWEVTLKATAPVMIPTATAADAPVVIEADWHAAAFPRRMTWREHDGALWRPLVGTTGEVLDTADGFARGVERAELPIGRADPHPWTDYPFNVRSEGSHQHGRGPFNQMREGQPGLRVRSSNREAAIALAQRTAADDLLVIDGVMHMRSKPPVWAVGNRDRLQVDAGRVTLAIPDFKGHDNWLCTFPLDRREEAVAFATAHAERIGAIPWLVATGRGDAPELEIDPVDVRHGDMDFPDTRADDLRRVFLGIERNLRGCELRQFDRRLLKAYADIGMLAEDAAAGHADWTDDSRAAVDALASAIGPGRSEAWPYMAEIAEAMRSLARRDELADRLTAEEDLAWMSGPGL